MHTVRSITLTFAAALLAAAVPSMALAQEGAAPPDDLLRGPAVVDEDAGRPARPRRGFDGAMQLPDRRIELIALESLTLGDAEKAATDELIARRGVEVRRLLDANLDLLLEMNALRQAGDRQGLQAKLPEFRAAAQPLLEPTLADQIAAALSTPNAEAFRSAVQAQREAMRRELRRPRGDAPPPREGMGDGMDDDAPRRRGPAGRGGQPAGDDDAMDAPRRRPGGDGADAPRRGRPDGAPDGPGPARGPGEGRRGPAGGPGAAPPPQAEEAMALMRELGATLASEIDFRKAALDDYLAQIQATPEQAERIRTILRDQAARPGGQGDRQARQRLFGEIMPLLTPAQRKTTILLLRG